MRRSLASLLGACAVLSLSSCGGGDGGSPIGGGGPTPTPSPSPTPTPTPTPPPSPTYPKFAELTGDRTFATACEVYSGRGNGVPASDGSKPYTQGGNINFSASSSSWTIFEINGGRSATFGPPHLVASSATGFSYEIPGSPPQRFSSTAPDVNGVRADYGRSVSYLIGGGTGPAQAALCNFGVPTLPSDIPAATTVTYNQITLRGLVFEQNPAGGAAIVSQIVSGSGSITGNTTTGLLTFSLTYVARAPNGTETTVGPITGTLGVDIGSDRAGYHGPLVPPSGAPNYFVNGAFYGPQGTETGFVVRGQFDQDSNGLNERFVLIDGYARR